MLRSTVGASMGLSVTVDRVKLTYDDEGSGPVLLCLHAIGHGARDFEGLRNRLKNRYRVIALDFPGQGNSSTDHTRPGAVRYAELVAGFIDALGIQDVVILGNSVGGGAAIRYAHDHPERARAIVLVNSSGLDRFDALTSVVTRAMSQFFRAGARGARWFPRAYALYYRMVLPRKEAREQRLRIAACGPEVAEVLADAWLGFGETAADQRDAAAALTCPVLVAWARGDQVNQLRRSMPAIRRIPRAEFKSFPGGHAPFLECQSEFGPVLEGFIERVSADRFARA